MGILYRARSWFGRPSLPPVVLPPEPPPRVVYLDDHVRKLASAQARELPTVGRLHWDTVGEVRGALQQLMYGQFQLAADLADAMMGDDRIAGTLSARLDGLLGTALEMHTPEGEEENATATEIAERARELWPTMAPESVLREILRWGRMLGACPYELLPVGGDPWTRRLKVWHPRFLYWVHDMSRQPYSGSWKLISGEGLIDLSLADDGTIESRMPNGAVEVGRFGLYTPFGYQRAWVHGLVRALAIPWLVRNWSLRDWARYSEIHGIPIRAFSMPSEWDEGQRIQAEAEIAALGSESVVRLPVDRDGKGFKLELIEPTGQSEEAFEKLIAKCDTSIAVAILGQNLTTEIGTSGSGSRAAAQVHDRVRADIVRSDAETLSTTLHDQHLVQWTEHHYGDRELAPWPHWDVEPPEDEGASAAAFLAVAQGIQALRSSNLNVDWSEQCEQLGVPLADGDPILEPPEPAPAPAPPPKKASRAATLARARPGADAGQEYIDGLGADLRDRAAKALAPDVRALREVLRNAKARPDGTIDGAALRAELARVYRGMNPADLARVLEKAILLARLQGGASVLEDL